MARIKWPEAKPDQAWLLDNGWKIRRKRNSQTRQIFLSPCGKFICKRGYISSDKPKSRHVIPCKFLSVGEDYKYSFHYRWVIQPLADVRKCIRSKAEDFLYDTLGDDVSDIHEHNVAMYRGRPVLIDW